MMHGNTLHDDALPSPLLVITDRHRATEPLTTVLANAARGGAHWMRVREPDLSLFQYVTLCHALIEAVDNARVIWSVRPHAYAMLRTAHPELRLAVHLTERDSAWAVTTEPLLVGRSVHRTARVTDEDASRDGDHRVAPGAEDVRSTGYSLLAPVFDTASKPDVTPLGILALHDYVRATPGPVVALGGITIARVAACRGAGAAAIAVCGGLMEADAPDERARAYLDAWYD